MADKRCLHPDDTEMLSKKTVVILKLIYMSIYACKRNYVRELRSPFGVLLLQLYAARSVFADPVDVLRATQRNAYSYCIF